MITGWEILASIFGITAIRSIWVLRYRIPHDVEPAIMPGLKSIGKFLRGEAIVGGKAPYGIIWYGMNLPIAKALSFNGRSWILALGMIDAVFIGIVWYTMGLLAFASYVLIGTLQLLRAPWNVSIDWIIVLGIFNPFFLIVAPVAKLPVGLPFHTFRDTRAAFFHSHNFIYYGLLGTLWLIVFLEIFFPSGVPPATALLGLSWALLLGYFYLQRRRG